MNYFGKLVSNVRGFYNEINAATLTGAIDVVVVRQDDGSFKGSPFHVRFGKLGVLRSREKVVDITVNGKAVNLHMKLGDAGEAFFVQECKEEEVPIHLATSPIPSAELLMEEGLKELHRNDSDVMKINESRNSSESRDDVPCDLESRAVLYMSNISALSDVVKEPVDDLAERGHGIVSEVAGSEKDIGMYDGKVLDKSKSIPIPVNRWRSDYPFSDSEDQLFSSPPADAGYKRSCIHALSDLDTPIASPLSLSPPVGFDIRQVLSDTEIELKNAHHPPRAKDDEGVTWQWGQLPKDSREFGKDVSSETVVPKRKRGDKSSKARQALFQPASEGLYLDDVLAADREVAALYLHGHGASSEDNDSGLGRDSVPVSPAHNENEGQLSGPRTLESNWKEQEILLSLCGDLKNEKTPPEHFHEHIVAYDLFCKNPSLLTNPKLVIKIQNRYYNWQVGAPYLMSLLAFNKPLEKDSLKSLKYQFMPRKRRGWFSWHSTYDDQDTTDDEDTNKKVERYRYRSVKNMGKEGEFSPFQSDPGSDGELPLPEKYKKVTRLTSDQWASLDLKEGPNDITFSVTTQYQGTACCTARIFLWNFYDKIVISDIDGTITRSDVLGQMLPLVGKDWSQMGVAGLYTKIRQNGFKFLYLSARAIGQSQITRDFLKSVRQGELTLPDGPVLLTPTSLIKAFQKEVIERKPEEFKIACMRDIQSLFPKSRNPFYSGFGNRINDVYAYRALGIPISRIFSINYKGEIKHELTNTFTSSYYKLIDLVDQMFPPLTHEKAIDVVPADFTAFNYWRIPPTEAELSASDNDKDSESMGT